MGIYLLGDFKITFFAEDVLRLADKATQRVIFLFSYGAISFFNFTADFELEFLHSVHSEVNRAIRVILGLFTYLFDSC